MSLETLVSLPWTHTHSHTHTPSSQKLSLREDFVLHFPSSWLGSDCTNLSCPQGGDVLPGLPVRQDQVVLLEKTVTFAQEQKVYFLILCNKTTAGGRSIASRYVFVFYLCFIYWLLSACLAFATAFSLNAETLRQAVERSEKLQPFESQRSSSKATTRLSSTAVTHFNMFSGSRTQPGDLELFWTASATPCGL